MLTADIVKYIFAHIPREIKVSGYEYTFQMFINHPHYDFRFCYYSSELYFERLNMMAGADEDLPLYFLYLQENIESDIDLYASLVRLKERLAEDGLLDKDYATPEGYSYEKHLLWLDQKK